MLDRKALADSLHALHSSEIKAGKDGAILKNAIGTILDAIATTKSGLGLADSQHLADAIHALAEGHPFLARSSILLVLGDAPAVEVDDENPPPNLAQLRDKLNAVPA